MEISERLQTVLLNYREDNNMSNAQLARHLDLDNATVSRWCDGLFRSGDKVDASLRKMGYRLGIVRLKDNE